MNFRNRYKPDPIGFQVVPMIDILFLLLCFFVTSQIYTQWETEVDITVPTAKTSQLPQRLPGEVILNVKKDGAVWVNGQHLDDARLQQMMQRLTGLFPGQPIVLRADKQTAYEHVMRVLDLCRQSDIWNISFATSIPEKQP